MGAARLELAETEVDGFTVQIISEEALESSWFFPSLKKIKMLKSFFSLQRWAINSHKFFMKKLDFSLLFFNIPITLRILLDMNFIENF